MGIRNRNSEKKTREDNKQKLHNARKEFTRAKAEHALRNGADPTEERFTEHRNYHVRLLAWRMAGAVIPETENERKALAERLSRGRTLQGKMYTESLLGLNKEGVEEQVKAA